MSWTIDRCGVDDVAMNLINAIQTRPLRWDWRAFRSIARNFTPNWFAVTMGTGALALALNQVPLALPGRREVAEGLWLLDAGVFACCALLYTIHWMFHRTQARRIFEHPVLSMFLGTIPMGLATILNGLLAFGSASGRDGTIHLASLLWCVDVALSLGCSWLVPYFMFTRQKHDLSDMTAVWLLPLVAAEVAAASGGLMLQRMPAGTHAQQVLIVSYALCGMSVLPAFGVLAILFLRMALHKLPNREMAATSWLALGPIGTAALSLLLLGDEAERVLAGTPIAAVAAPMRTIGVTCSFVLWGYGAWWLGTALLATWRYLRQEMPFNPGWWGFTFPLGVYSLATLALFRETGLQLFEISGCALVILLAAIWCIVGGRTVIFLWQSAAPIVLSATARSS
jgi:C4-dicarboxylate transporter/malic acid transport protein